MSRESWVLGRRRLRIATHATTTTAQPHHPACLPELPRHRTAPSIQLCVSLASLVPHFPRAYGGYRTVGLPGGNIGLGSPTRRALRPAQCAMAPQPRNTLPLHVLETTCSAALDRAASRCARMSRVYLAVMSGIIRPRSRLSRIPLGPRSGTGRTEDTLHAGRSAECSGSRSRSRVQPGKENRYLHTSCHPRSSSRPTGTWACGGVSGV